MKVALITPWQNVWLDYYHNEFSKRGWQFYAIDPRHLEQFSKEVGADLYVHGWGAGDSQGVAGARNVMFIRSYELFDGGLKKVHWDKIDQVICVNPAFTQMVQEYFNDHKIQTPVTCIYNGTPLERWSFKQRKFDGKIGMACHVHWKKNIPLALQILAHLPKDAQLHIAGEIQCTATHTYLIHFAKQIGRKVVLHNEIPIEQMNLWWEQFGVMLSTSIREGNPNNVIEAMAKGIKPVIHNWLGSQEQFPGYVFNTAEEAARMIQEPVESEKYRKHIEDNFSLKNIERVVDLCVSPL